MLNKDVIALIVLIVGGLTYSLISFAYMHSTFPSKDSFQMLVHKLDRIERKLDEMGR